MFGCSSLTSPVQVYVCSCVCTTHGVPGEGGGVETRRRKERSRGDVDGKGQSMRLMHILGHTVNWMDAPLHEGLEISQQVRTSHHFGRRIHEPATYSHLHPNHQPYSGEAVPQHQYSFTTRASGEYGGCGHHCMPPNSTIPGPRVHALQWH